jgi:hypothetical protein
MALTPARDVDSLDVFLRDPDMWTPETAVRLLEFRGYAGPIEPIERLAREGQANGDAAAMRLLARMRTSESEAAAENLRHDLSGPKLKQLEQWLALRDKLPPPRWY